MLVFLVILLEGAIAFLTSIKGGLLKKKLGNPHLAGHLFFRNSPVTDCQDVKIYL